MNTILTNTILILILLALCALGVKNTVAHIRGEGDCCGGGGKEPRIKPKKLSAVVCEKTLLIEGMMCDHCAGRIHNALNSIDGVNARVQRSKNRAVIRYEKTVEDAVIEKAVTDLGYRVKFEKKNS